MNLLLKLENGKKQKKEERRFKFYDLNEVEDDETHFLLKCRNNKGLRKGLIDYLISTENSNLTLGNNFEELKLLFARGSWGSLNVFTKFITPVTGWLKKHSINCKHHLCQCKELETFENDSHYNRKEYCNIEKRRIEYQLTIFRNKCKKISQEYSSHQIFSYLQTKLIIIQSTTRAVQKADEGKYNDGIQTVSRTSQKVNQFRREKHI